jgi:two-component system nitrogen regulation response regulator GlnG
LIPAHLFGARRGAYTGAVDDQIGVFEQAHDGTLFLDEIGNLDLDLQRQLLLVLERGVVARLGDTRTRQARPKLVAATNQDLASLVAQGRFRADLYMRLNPATKLHIPPLRQRQIDLSDLTRFAFLAALNSKALRPLVRSFLARFPTPRDFDESKNSFIVGRPTIRATRDDAFTLFLGKEALGRVLRHPWPGNLRELSLFAQNALVFALTRQLDTPQQSAPAPRAPAILEISDALVSRLLIVRKRILRQPESDEGAPVLTGRAVEINVPTGDSFQQVSVDVERQYMRALFYAARGDLEEMAQGLLGPRGDARRVHLRLNQLGLKLRELRAGLQT